jgi:hypothetical protein
MEESDPQIRCPAISDRFGIDVVRGSLDEESAEALRALWAQHAQLDEAEMERRLSEVVCVLRGGDGKIAGACSVFTAEIPLIGGRRFHVLRALLPGAARERFFDLFAAAHAALDAQYDGSPADPIGLCALIEEPERRARPEAEWSDPRTIYAGYLGDGRQVRLAYYSAALSAGHIDWEGEAGYRIVPYAEQDAVGPDAIVDLWTSEGVLDATEAGRRVDEVMLVAIGDDGRLAGVTTRFLRHNDQLRMDLWYVRAFTAAAYRKSAVATALAVRGREYLERRFVSGQDTRAPGLIYEVESELLQRLFPNAIWKPADVLFIGENANGAHVRVHYFDGAMAPEPG